MVIIKLATIAREVNLISHIVYDGLTDKVRREKII